MSIKKNKNMRIFIVILLLFFLSILVKAQQCNNIGFDFGGFIVSAPKLKLVGDKYNPYLENRSALLGLYYERYLGESSYSLKSGLYFNYQFNCIRSFHVPVEFNGSILGKRNEKYLYLGYTGGFSYNSMIDVLSSVSYFVEPGTSADVAIKKSKYIAPHIGLNGGINFKRVCLSGIVLYHFLIPEFIDYKVTYNNHQVVEHNTNSRNGVSFRIGASYRF